ncbi:D-Ala-D-Ala carboxypeptidase family metallohydrolase [Sphingomonas mesophila]|uniref:D-Ala-D-Ala carboxypeptidase family metallohydrolase n=1 Tax=Sphingomonas mesophila TaxID=2303576 RepID=UPI000E587876|nr:D-Ala-D-Ala carboxypeptidase family metallohydrolase [Sphingomonas mesophila]
MHFALTLMLLLFAPAAASTTPTSAAAQEYVMSGQDEPGYRRWMASDLSRAIQVRAFNDYLVANGVGGVAPTWQLIRTASHWWRCSGQPFEVPPTEHWPNIVQALRYIGAFVEPAIGEVEVVSAYRNPALNQCAGGAGSSTHLTGGGIDMVPISAIDRERLMERLCRIQLDKGWWNGIGLGFYKGLRFHIDARKNREWGTAGAAGGYGCAAVLREGAKPFVESPAGSDATAVPPPTQ